MSSDLRVITDVLADAKPASWHDLYDAASELCRAYSSDLRMGVRKATAAAAIKNAPHLLDQTHNNDGHLDNLEMAETIALGAQAAIRHAFPWPRNKTERAIETVKAPGAFLSTLISYARLNSQADVTKRILTAQGLEANGEVDRQIALLKSERENSIRAQWRTIRDGMLDPVKVIDIVRSEVKTLDAVTEGFFERLMKKTLN